ncbi:MAG TPA: HlyD family efflux transporter periplasmic adaptor subunit [bacterium]|nr:HlyD family efflux transporter periplasmic adaptor subunit [bacterium]
MKALAIALALLLTSVSSGCRLGRDSELRLSGTLEMTEHTVGARVAGRITTLNFDEGQEVTKSQLLATLDRFEQAQRDIERLKRQLSQGGVSQQAVEQGDLNVDDQRVLSPVDGVVLVKVRETGEIVAAGGPVAVIGDTASVWVRVYVPEGSIARVRLGTPASISFDGASRDVPGKVIYIAPQAEFTPRNVQSEDERVTQTFAVKVALDRPEPWLKPGIAADVTLKLEARP